MSRTEPNSQEQRSAAASQDQDSEIYHSLEDAIPLSQDSQSNQPSTPGSTVSTAPRMASGGNAPLTGQVCRCVAQIIHI
jgi:hypothetical protein